MRLAARASWPTAALRGSFDWIAVAAAALIVHAGALGRFFSQDDFAGLARADGLLPRLAGPWRWISQQAFWDVMRVVAGLEPFRYHLASLIVHSAGAIGVWAWLRRRVSRPAALVGAVFLAAHPALFTATHWISAIGDPLALAFGAAVLLLAERRDGARWLALPAFAAALLCKESVVTLPLVVWIAAAAPPHSPAAAADARPAPPRAARDPLLWMLAATALAAVVYLAATDAMGARREGPAAAYALGWGTSLAGNLLTYLGWSVDFAFAFVRRFSDARDPEVYGWAVAALAIAAAGMAWAPLRRRGFGHACLCYLALLLPVLPLVSHTYHYYLELPMLGAAWAVGIAFDALLARGPAALAPRKWAAGFAAIAIAILLGWNGALLVRRCETAPFGLPGLLADPVMDRARIARQVRDDIAEASLGPGVRLALWLPDGWAYPGATPPPAGTPRVPYTRLNLRSALLDGLALRVLFPAECEARVVDRHERLPADWSWALCRPDGRLHVLRSTELDSLLVRYGDPR